MRLSDAQTHRPRPGLVRVRQADGTAVPLPGLINRGLGLRQNHPGKEWYVLPADATVTVPRGVLTIETVAGIETELARTTVDTTARPPRR